MDSDFVTRKIKRRDNLISFLDQLEKLHELQKDNRKKTPYPYDEKKGIIRIPKKLEEELKHLTRNGKKIEAMKKVGELDERPRVILKDMRSGML